MSRAVKVARCISVKIEGDKPRFLAGHCASRNDATILLTDNIGEAVTSLRPDTLTIGWPYLICSHLEKIGKRGQAVIHRVDESPIFAE